MVPVVDIGAFVKAVGKVEGEGGTVSVVHNQPEVKAIARLVHDAVCQYGFCFLENHELPQHVVDRVFSTSKSFFELDTEVKNTYIRGKSDCHGWLPVEKERLNIKRQHGDLKETFNFSPCAEKDLPTEVPALAQSFQDMFDACHVLCGRILDLLGVALELEDPTLLNKSHQLCGKKGSYSTLRTVFYPLSPCKEGQVQCGEHSDYGSISLFFQDDTGGLQILGKDGEYHDVASVPGTVLVLVGDLLQRWTADKYPAANHRVMVPPKDTDQSKSARQNLTFFYYPDDQAVISCLDGSDTYAPVTPLDYLMSKFADVL